MSKEDVRRYGLSAVAFILFSCMLGGWLQANVQEWAKANGQDQYLVVYAKPVFEMLASLAQNPVFVALAWASIGGAVFLWAEFAMRGFREKKARGGGSSEKTPEDGVQLNALRIESGSAPPFSVFEALSDGRIRKTFGLAVVNNGESELSNCRFHLTGIAPNDAGWHLPLQLHSDPFALNPAQRQVIDTISYLEGASDFRVKLPPTGTMDYNNSLPIKTYTLTFEASSDQSKPVRLLCRAQIDHDGQFQFWEATGAASRANDIQIPNTKAVGQSAPLLEIDPVHLALKWIPSAWKEDIVAAFTIEANRRAQDVVLIGRYAEATHYLDRTEWTWGSSTRLDEMKEITPPENWQIEAIRRPRQNQPTASIFGKFIIDVTDEKLILVRLDVLCGDEACHIAKAFNLTPSNEGKVLQYVNLDDIAYIKGLEPKKPSSLNNRAPALEFFDLAKNEFGWDFDGRHSLDILDFTYGLRQAGADGLIGFWGKANRNDFESLTRNELLVAIPKDHWVDYEIDWWKAREKKDNFYMLTVNKRATGNVTAGGFTDVYIDRKSVTEWLNDGAAKFKGHTRR